MKTIRKNVFETNSSSTHSLTMCSEETYKKWQNGEIMFDVWKDEFRNKYEITEETKKQAQEDYEATRTEYKKEWNELSDELKEKWYDSYVAKEGLESGDLMTYEKYMYDYGCDLENFKSTYTTEHGDKIVAFGKYGYDG